MSNSNRIIFLLKERIRAAEIVFRKKTFLRNKSKLYGDQKIKKYEDTIKSLNKHLIQQDKKISTFRLSTGKGGSELLIKKIETSLFRELKTYEERVHNLSKKLNQIKTVIIKKIKDKKKSKTNIEPLKEDLLGSKKNNSNLKKKIKSNRLEIERLKKELKSKTDQSKEGSVNQESFDNAGESLEQACEYLFEIADEIAKENLSIHQFTEARSIYKRVMSQNYAEKKLIKSSEIVFIENTVSNLTDFGRSANLNLMNSKKRQEDLIERNRHLKNETDTCEIELSEIVETNRRNSGDQIGGASFFVSFSDVISVLLCFFILFFALGKVDADKAKRLASTFQEDTIKVNTFNAYLSADDFIMLEKVKELLRDNVELDSIVEGENKTIEYVISGSELFSPGETEISSKGVMLLRRKLKKDLKGRVEEIIIEGHTDDKELTAFPETRKKYRNNLEFSAERALRVAQIIRKDLGRPLKGIGIRAYGSNKPLKPNTSDHFRALNRRVVIQIIKKNKINRPPIKKDHSSAKGNLKSKKI